MTAAQIVVIPFIFEIGSISFAFGSVLASVASYEPFHFNENRSGKKLRIVLLPITKLKQSHFF